MAKTASDVCKGLSRLEDEISRGQKRSLVIRRTRAMRHARRMVPHLVKASKSKAWTSNGALAGWLNQRSIWTIRGNPWTAKSIAILLKIDDKMREEADRAYADEIAAIEEMIGRSPDPVDARKRLAETIHRIEVQRREALDVADGFWSALEQK